MRKNLVFTPLMVLLAAGAVHAQDTSSAVLAGRVTNQEGQPLQGVRVLVESSALLGSRQATTDATGQFRVPVLPNGEYTITYTINGYLTRKLTMRLIAGSTANGSARLTPMGVAEATVEIIGRTAQIDKTDTVVQTSFSSDFLEKIGGRNIGTLSNFVPGANTSLTDQGRLSVRGGTGRSTKLLIDGSTATELWGGYTISTFNMDDLIESVSLMQSPVNARYGNTDGGIVSIVTSKGSNTFTGTIRVGLGRDYWSILDGGYGYRDSHLPGGEQPSPIGITTEDGLSKNYQVTVQGPIWKDRVTFAYGARLTPTRYYTRNMADYHPEGALWTTPQYQPRNYVGTFFEADNGDVIRKSELYLKAAQDNSGVMNASSWSRYNQFALNGQITPSHSVEWNYSESKSGGTNNLQRMYMNTMEAPWITQGTTFTNWSAAYKGIIGSSGVLEARYGKNYSAWWYGPQSGTVPNAVRHYNINSLIPLANGDINNWNQPGAPIGSTNNYSHYLSNGYVGANIGSGANSTIRSDMTLYNPGAGQSNLLGEGFDYGRGDNGGTTTTVINYQHVLNTAKGNHIIDLGMQSDQFTWSKNARAETFYSVPGRIAKDLTAADIYNRFGQASAPASAYAGKYIVYNVLNARISDIDPWGVENYKLIDQPVYNQATNAYYNTAIGIPTMEERFGGEGGGTEYWATQRSFYLNDLWSINDNHSVQGGVRVDMFNIEDSGVDLLTYTQPTFRFEYKWDIMGDQSRLLNVSWAQYHSMPSPGLFSPFVTVPLQNNRSRLWTGNNPNGTNKPYLVTLEEVRDINNYGFVRTETISASGIYAIDQSWKAPISTEYSVGFRRNLMNGGYWKATFSQRTWVNAYHYALGDPIVTSGTSPQRNIQRVLTNVDGYERKYTGVELEWDLPIHKRVSFGGSYTYNRLMDNTPDIIDQPGGGNVGSSPTASLDWWWDEIVPGGREAWMPVRPIDPEHFFKWYLLFDLSSNRVNSSLSFYGQYTSASFQQDGYNMQYGYPYEYYPDYMQGTNGGDRGAVGGINTASVSSIFGGNTVFVPFNVYSTNRNDRWNLTMRYMVTVPLARKISWMATINVNNPFNHRGRYDQFTINGASTNIVPVTLTGGGTTPARDIYQGVWKETGTVNSQYINRMGGRSFGIETGLRF